MSDHDLPVTVDSPVKETALQDGLASHPATPTAPWACTAPSAGLPGVPGYDLLEEVGRGGMGVVYQARDTALARDVAVKLLQPEFAPGSSAVRRFRDEARITAQLQHPGIPPVHEVGTLPDGRPFLAMKLIKGQTLDELLRKRANPTDDHGRLLAIFEAVCQAVGFAHAHGVIHRDLKPSNVMVGAFGEVQVMDWGLAKVLKNSDPQTSVSGADGESSPPATQIHTDLESGDATRAGSVLGTPAFMPPEQAIGALDQVDARSDVFGLGAILCVILTGQPPYVGADAESTRQLAARANLADALTRLADCGAGSELVALCKRCLESEKDLRPPDAGAVALAVADFRAATEERARRAELDRVRADAERARAEAEVQAQRKRRRLQLALAATLGLILVGGAGAATYTARQAEARVKERDEAYQRQRALGRGFALFLAKNQNLSVQQRRELTDQFLANYPEFNGTEFADLFDAPLAKASGAGTQAAASFNPNMYGD